MLRFVQLAFATGLTALLLWPTPGHACGGCFAPTGQPSQVTAHRMAVAITPQASTLWDQFEYVGAPEDFVWVLPVAGGQDVRIDLAEDTFFQSLTQATQITLQGPFTGGGGGGGGGSVMGCGGGYGSAASSGTGTPPVVVYQQETVGPYETLVVGSDSGQGLTDWLVAHGYAIPETLTPVIEHYVARDSNFVVVRLAPGEGISRMQPVRVTCPSAMIALPLRMIAAGVEDTVSLELFVFADTRHEAVTFPNAEIPRDELTYNVLTGTFNYDALASEALRSNDGRTWLTEFAGPAPLYAANQPIYDDAGQWDTAAEDWAHVTELLPNPYLTRMRAVLPVDALAEDLMLGPSVGGDLPSFIQVDRTTDSTTTALLAATPERGMAAPVPLILLAGLGLGAAFRRRRPSA